ncbi:hypothetical protein GCM10009092_28230 [Bowmanella denitrificans]|uniref:Uncharacterized protein n=1 Tax=Bowmanella denitrificans TaxID=366582 RepID=A0ABP3H5B8_9ALTE|nr:hypothetical protein [Bowmanella denitrificans]
MRLDPRITPALLFIGSLLVLQMVYFFAARQAHYQQAGTLALALEKRIALDLPWLRLPNDVMNNVADEESVRQYLSKLNELSLLKGYSIRVLALQGISASQSKPEFDGIIQQHKLQIPGQTLTLQLGVQHFPLAKAFSIFPLLAALLFTLLISSSRRETTDEQLEPGESPSEPALPRLIVNLQERTLSNSVDNRQIQLSNKPFCFYVALLEYCLQHENAALNHNKNIPEELLELANRYFYRLIELGHTIRKRPDFSSNLDKMLSEIRAALDDVFRDCPEFKAAFYPPKAQGEGSRSKLHNYALEQLQAETLEIIGK